jgi:hypothetical protein
MFFMAGVLEQLIRPQKRAMSQKAMELEAAREILAEVFKVRLSEVDEMIRNRFDQARPQEACGEKDRLWPQEFWLE